MTHATLSALVQRATFALREHLGPQGVYRVGYDGSVTATDGEGRRLRLILAAPGNSPCWLPEAPLFRLGLVDEHFAGRQPHGSPYLCPYCKGPVEPSLLLLIEDGRPLCDACGALRVPFLFKIRQIGLRAIEEGEEER